MTSLLTGSETDPRRAWEIDLPVRVDALRIDRGAAELADRGPEVVEVVDSGELQQLRGVRLERIVDGGLRNWSRTTK